LDCWKSSLAGGAPTPKSRDLAEDERLQAANWLLQSVAIEMRLDVGAQNLADCESHIFDCLCAFGPRSDNPLRLSLSAFHQVPTVLALHHDNRKGLSLRGLNRMSFRFR